MILLGVNISVDPYLFHTELRKESRQLENEIDLKLVSFSKLGSSYSHRDIRYALA